MARKIRGTLMRVLVYSFFLYTAAVSDYWKRIRARLLRMGIEVALFRPLGRRPADGDLLSIMAKNLERALNRFGNSLDSP